MKVFSLKNSEILLKEPTKNIISQGGEFLTFIRPLMTVGLLLTKNVLRTLPKSAFYH